MCETRLKASFPGAFLFECCVGEHWEEPHFGAASFPSRLLLFSQQQQGQGLCLYVPIPPSLRQVLGRHFNSSLIHEFASSSPSLQQEEKTFGAAVAHRSFCVPSQLSETQDPFCLDVFPVLQGPRVTKLRLLGPSKCRKQRAETS